MHSTMSRYGTKTYSRSNQRESFASKAFDDVFGKDTKLSTAKAASTIQRWGTASFTSTRGSQVHDNDTRKRRNPDAPAEEEDMFCSDIFSFDSDDDGPKNPERGMGYKIADKPNNDNGPGVKSLKRANNDKTHATKPKKANSATSSTANSNSVHKTVASSDPKKSAAKQTSMDAFISSNHTKLNVRHTAALQASQPKSLQHDKPMKKTKKKFFRSSLNSSNESITDHNYSHTEDSTDDSLTQPSDNDEEKPIVKDTFDSDDLDNLESGDPEIIFNSPKKRSAEKKKNTELHRAKVPVASSCENDAVPVNDSDSVCSSRSMSPATTRRLRVKIISGPGSDSGSDGSVRLERSARGRFGLLDRARDKTRKKFGEPIVRRLLTSPKKRTEIKAVYNPRQWHGDPDDQDRPTASQPKSSSAAASLFDDCFDDEDDSPSMLLKEAPVLRRTITSPDSDDASPIRSYGSSAKAKVQVNRQHKQLFTVVHNVKQAHECQEHGETQEFEDDIEYIMDGLDDAQPISVRCLSTVSLATKCTVASFRMHLRAHSTLSKIFTALHDASQHATLALCTAAVMFMLSRDRLNMDLEKSSLELMLSLMSVDEKHHASATSGGSKDYRSMKEKIKRIFESVRNSNVKGAKNWQIDNISPGHLAMETLLSLTSKQAGDWFKEDLRIFGGLDHIIDTVCTCEDQLDDCVIEPTTVMLDSLQRIDRCLRVLENVTYLNIDNQKYLIEEKSSVLIRCLCRSLKVCENCLPFNEVGVNGESVDKHCVGYSLYSCMLAILRVLLNLTHENKVGCSKVGQHGGFIKMMLTCILRIPSFIPSSERFDLLVLGLGLLINLTEHCEDNRRLLVATKTVICFDSSRPLTGSVSVEALEALTQLFVQHHDAARRVEEEHDQEMDQRNKVHSKKTAGGSTGVDGATDNSMNEEAEQSGVWQESEAGLEWVVIPQADRPEDEGKENNGGDDDDELRIQTSSQDDDENVTKALHRMGRHMEDCIVAAYTGLLVGTIIQTDSDLADRVVGWLPQAQFEPMIRMLKKFLGFMNFTSTSNSAQNSSRSIAHIIAVLENF